MTSIGESHNLHSTAPYSHCEEVNLAKLPLVRLYTDGGARGNPGPAAIGIVVCDGDDRIIKEFPEYIGRATNNQAEYRALIRGLDVASNYTDGAVVCTLDSELVVRQMTGRYRAKNAEMAKLAEQTRRMAGRFKSVDYVNLPRMTGHLANADRQVNAVLDEVMKHPIDDTLRASITKRVEIGRAEGPEEDDIDPQAIGGAFLEFCVTQGWVVRKGSGGAAKCYVTEVGRKELRAFGIVL